MICGFALKCTWTLQRVKDRATNVETKQTSNGQRELFARHWAKMYKNRRDERCAGDLYEIQLQLMWFSFDARSSCLLFSTRALHCEGYGAYVAHRMLAVCFCCEFAHFGLFALACLFHTDCVFARSTTKRNSVQYTLCLEPNRGLYRAVDRPSISVILERSSRKGTNSLCWKLSIWKRFFATSPQRQQGVTYTIS